MTKMTPQKPAHNALSTNEATQTEQEQRPIPKVSQNENGQLALEDLGDDVLKQVYGTQSGAAARGLLVSSLEAMGVDAGTYRQFMLTVGAELQPRTSIEAMLVIQLCVCHVSMMRFSGKLNTAKSPNDMQVYERIYTRLSQTFGKELESYRRLLQGPSQTIRVERFNVESGANAVVGNVQQGGLK